MQQAAGRPSSISETDKYLVGMCPAGCFTNHGGPSAARLLAELWRERPEDARLDWPDFLTLHGRDRLADEYPEPPATGG